MFLLYCINRTKLGQLPKITVNLMC